MGVLPERSAPENVRPRTTGIADQREVVWRDGVDIDLVPRLVAGQAGQGLRSAGAQRRSGNLRDCIDARNGSKPFDELVADRDSPPIVIPAPAQIEGDDGDVAIVEARVDRLCGYKPRVSRPAEISSTMQTATWMPMSMPRSQPVRRPVPRLSLVQQRLDVEPRRVESGRQAEDESGGDRQAERQTPGRSGSDADRY